MESLKLSRLEAKKLNEKEMGMINGGIGITVTVRTCTCSCYYADQGGSSIEANRDANYKIGDGGFSGDGNNEHYTTTVDVSINTDAGM